MTTDAPKALGGAPFFGVLPQIANTPLEVFTRVAKQGDVVSLGRTYFPGTGIREMVFINHPHLVDQVLRKNYKIFQKDFSILKQVLGEGLFTSEGETWRRQRRLAQPAFHTPQLKAMTETMNRVATEIVASWSDGDELSMDHDMATLTLRMVLGTLFTDHDEHLYEVIQNGLGLTFEELHQRIWEGITLPDWVPTKRNRALRKTIQSFDEVIYPLIEKRRTMENPPHDLLSMLLDARDEDTGEGMNDLQLRDEVITMLFAGHETTASTLSWAMANLDAHPAALQKVLDEVDQVGDGPLGLNDLKSLTYVRAVLDETLRLSPPAWIFTRMVVEDTELGGVKIPKHSEVIVSPYTCHRDARFWPEPDRFNPERWLPEPTHDKTAYFPFSSGPRKCIGQRFAIAEAMVVLVKIYKRFIPTRVSKNPPKCYPMLSMRTDDGNPMRLVARTTS